MANERTIARFVLAAGVFLATAVHGRGALADTLQVGKPAPEIALAALDGRQFDTRAMSGKVVIVTFWATWCPPCREELPLLSAYADKHAAQGLQIIGFSLNGADSLSAVKDAAAALHFPVGLLPSPWAGGYGRIWHIPVSFVIDRQGRLAYNGWTDPDPVWTEAKLEAIVTPLLAGN